MRLRRVTIALATAAALLGAGHTALTPLEYPGWTRTGLWFVGTGLAMLTAAAINIVGLGSVSRPKLWLIILVDVAMTAFFIAAWPVLRGTPVMVGGALFASLAVCNVTRGARSGNLISTV